MGRPARPKGGATALLAAKLQQQQNGSNYKITSESDDYDKCTAGEKHGGVRAERTLAEFSYKKGNTVNFENKGGGSM